MILLDSGLVFVVYFPYPVVSIITEIVVVGAGRSDEVCSRPALPDETSGSPAQAEQVHHKVPDLWGPTCTYIPAPPTSCSDVYISVEDTVRSCLGTAALTMSRLLTSFLLLGAVGLLGCRADIPGDLIKSLPGWSGATPTAQYSGYIDISSTKHMHYW